MHLLHRSFPSRGWRMPPILLAACLSFTLADINAVEGSDDRPRPVEAGKDRGQRPPPRDGQRQGQGRGAQAYNIEQAISDNAQLHTISFSGLAFLTGDFGASTFIPPGKVCDFFGFQYLRDVDAQGAGHNPKFLDRIVGNVLTVLDAGQQQRFLDLAKEQTSSLEDLARLRLPVIAAFHRQADGQIPAGSQGLDRQAVMAAVGAIFRRDADLSLRRAEVMAAVARSLTEAQKTALEPMKFGDFATWPDRGEVRDLLRDKTRGQGQMFNVAFMTYASEFFSWTKGSVEADTYFCPERHGTYFGGFYMKDMPAMGKKDFDISTAVTGESGRILVEDILDATQRALLTGLLETQRPALKEIVTVRRAIALELRRYLNGQIPDRETVLGLGERYGRLDGETSWAMAVAFARIKASLNPTQQVAMRKLRNLEGYTSAPFYIYSRAEKAPIDVTVTADRLFFPPKS